MHDLYAVEVEVSTHDALKDGVLALSRSLGGSDFTTVYVSALEAHSDDEAVLVACQMAACTSGGMPTTARLVSWPTEES